MKSSNTENKKPYYVPIWHKANLNVEEAIEYTGIGRDKLKELSDAKDCTFVLWVGSKRLLKRKKLEEFLNERIYV